MLEEWQAAHGGRSFGAGWMTAEEVADFARCAPVTLTWWTRTGHLHPRKSRVGRLYFSRAEVIRFLLARVATPATGFAAAWRRLARESLREAEGRGSFDNESK